MAMSRSVRPEAPRADIAVTDDLWADLEIPPELLRRCAKATSCTACDGLGCPTCKPKILDCHHERSEPHDKRATGTTMLN